MSQRQHQSVPQTGVGNRNTNQHYYQDYNNIDSSPQYNNFSDQSPLSQSYNQSPPQQHSNRYYYDANGSPTSNVKYDNKPSEFSEKKRAQLQREKAQLDDNMKDLTYMELISGTKQVIKKQINQNSSPISNYNRNNQNLNKTPITNKKTYQGYNNVDKSNEKDFSMNDLKGPVSPDSIEKQNRVESYIFFQNNNGQGPSPIQKGTDYNRAQDQGLTPKAAKHYEGVKNLYRQELDVLKHNIFQCMQQDQRLIPTFEQKEQKIWQSFSRSPSPNKYAIEDSQIINEDDGQNQNSDYYYDPSPTKLNEVIKPENILKNEIYFMMLKGPQQQHNTSGNNLNDSSGLFTYSKNPEYSQVSNGNALKMSDKHPNGIQPYDNYAPKGSMIQNIQERQEHSEESRFPIEDEIEKLRRENEKLRSNLLNLNDPKSQQQKGVSFSSKEKSSIHYYDKNSPSIATNPYQQNLYNSAQKDKNKGSNILTEENAFVSDNSNMLQAHNLTLSPYAAFNQQQYANPRDQQYSMLINADQQQLSQLMHEENEQNLQLRKQQEEENNSPYKMLSYFDQMKKNRETRQKEEKEMQMAELKRNAFQRNVLRTKQKQQQGENSARKSVRKSQFGNQGRNRSARKQSNSKVNDNMSEMSNKYQTPNRVQNQLMESMNSHRSQLSLMEMASFTQLAQKDYIVEYKNYMRKVSKYDLDRCQVDFGKLKREKQSQRNDDVKSKKEEATKEGQAKLQEEAEATAMKIQQLQTVKEKQEKERREFIRKQQEMFRKAIEDRQQVDKNQQYLSPNMPAQGKSGKSVQRKTSSKVTPVKLDQSADQNKQWASEIPVEGSDRKLRNNNNKNTAFQLPLQNIDNNGDYEQKQEASDEDIESYKIVFDLFDKDHSGYIDHQDLQEIALSLNRDPQEVIQLVYSFDPNSDGRLGFEEFVTVMRQLESRIVDSSSQEGVPNEDSMINDSDKRKREFGSMLPRNGVNFLPDGKVLDFLKLLNDYQKKCEKDLKYIDAKKAREKFQLLAQREMERQQINMQKAQKGELEQIEVTQKEQFLEFSKAWDTYMAEYETAAYKSLEKLKEKHDIEVAQLQEYLKTKYPIKYTYSKELMDTRAMEKKHFTLKEYEKAEFLKRQSDRMEQEERQNIELKVFEKIEKEEMKMRNKQQSQLNSLLKRIQRDRDEQLKHRMIDSQRLIQRNRNLLADIVQKQQLESKKTLEFLKYSLGKRSPVKAQRSFTEQQQNESTTQNPNKLPLIKSVMSQYQNSELQDYSQNAKIYSHTPGKDAQNTSVFLTDNNNNISDYQPAKNAYDYRQKGSQTQNNSNNRSQSTTKKKLMEINNPFASHNQEIVNAISKRSNHSSNRSFQTTETMAKNFKRLQKMQNSISRYHSTNKSISSNQSKNRALNFSSFNAENRSGNNEYAEQNNSPPNFIQVQSIQMKQDELLEHEVITDKTLSYHDSLFKIIIIGDSGIGKSCVLKRLVENEFKEDHDVTVGVEFGSYLIRVEDKVLKLQIWDTAGQESFRSITKIFYRGAHAAILGYSITRKDAFENLNDWLKEAKTSCSPDVQLYLIGNKSDLENQREVSFEQGLEFKRENNITYFTETSAKSGENIDKLFIDVAKFIYLKYKDQLHKMIDDETSSQTSQTHSMDMNQHNKVGTSLKAHQLRSKLRQTPERKNTCCKK